MTTDAAAARTRVAEALLRIDAAGGLGWPKDRSPFPGLRPLDTDEHSVFFGRAREIDQLAALLRSPAEQAERAVLLVVGPSGCGKSSLVRAGLLPVMAADEDWWTLPAILPGAHPMAALARELAASAHQLGLTWTVADVTRWLDDGDLTRLVDDLLLAVPGRRRRHLLLVVDQFEELLTQTGPEERARFAELLRDALAGPLQVVATLRPEFLDQILASPELAGLPARTHAVRPLRPEALRAVIEGPADRAGIGIDEELVARLVADTGGGEALPLLAYTLAQLADGVARGGRLLTTRYEQLGEVHGVLARQADVALSNAVAAGRRDRDQVIRELLRLVTVNEQGRPTRWRIRQDELPDQVIAEWQPFVDRRLLTTDIDNGQGVIGVAHEAFLSAWPPLSEAISGAASALRARRQLEQAADEWAENGHAPSRLWERGQLAAVLAVIGAHREKGDVRGSFYRWPRLYTYLVIDRVELSHRAKNFLEASIRRDRRRRNRAATVLSIILVPALIVMVFAIREQRAEEESQRQGTARLLVLQAETLLDRDPRTALRLLATAHHLHPDHETRSAMTDSLLATPYAGTIADGSGDLSIASIPSNGRILATGGLSGGTLWDITDPAVPEHGAVLSHLAPGDNYVESVADVALVPDGHILATVSSIGVRLLDTTNLHAPQHRAVISTGRGLDLTSDVTDVALASGGHILATGSDKGVTLWDITDPTAPQLLAFHDTGPAIDVAFTSDGHILATGSDKGVTLWDVTGTAGLQPLASYDTGPAIDVAFTSDGHILATVGGEGLTLWDITDPAETRQLDSPLAGYTGPVYSAAFAPDGHILAIDGEDGLSLWDVGGLDPPLDTPQADTMGHACSITGGGLDHDEWDLYVPGFAYVDVCGT